MMTEEQALKKYQEALREFADHPTDYTTEMLQNLSYWSGYLQATRALNEED